MHSSILRDMSILGYLGQLQPPDVASVLPLHSLVPYQVCGPSGGGVPGAAGVWLLGTESCTVNVFWKMGEKCSVIQGNKLISVFNQKARFVLQCHYGTFSVCSVVSAETAGFAVGVVGGFLVGFEFRLIKYTKLMLSC